MEQGDHGAHPAADHTSDSTAQHLAGSPSESQPSKQYPVDASSETNQSGDEPDPFIEMWEFIKKPEHASATMAIFTVFIFIATVAYAGIALAQWWAMKESNWINRDVFVRGSRPWIGLEGSISVEALQSTPRLVIASHYTIKNFGNSPAVKVFPFAIPILDTQNLNYIDVAKSSCLGPIEFVTGTVPVGPKVHYPGPMGYILFPNQTRLEQVGGGAWTGASQPNVKHIWFVGCIAYIDQFHTVHWTRFCVESSYSDPGPINKETPLQFCALYNDTGDEPYEAH